jgi:ACT domain-containing protein
MHSLEMVVEIRVLARQGKTIKEIVRETGLSRKTVRKYLQVVMIQCPGAEMESRKNAGLVFKDSLRLGARPRSNPLAKVIDTQRLRPSIPRARSHLQSRF